MSKPSNSAPASGTNFIRTIIDDDLNTGKTNGRVITRFPPEPNGYLHIGHAKSICLNFGLAQDYKGQCHLRFDDTNPETEDMEYVESIKRDVQWLGFDWGTHLYHASDYFEELYQYALKLIKDGKAYVDSLNEEEIRSYRGTVMEPGKESPYRNRSVEENLDLFERMRAGEFADGAHVLRAKMNMASNNMKERDPLLYRIKKADHYRTAGEWCIYPMYDYAHPLSDALEDITHSICTLEFENNRAIYDWVVENTFQPPRPHQYEFARLNLEYTITSKRKLLQLVEEGHVTGWDDPRMTTLSGLRRRGYTPSAIRKFCDRIGVAKTENRIDMSLLEYSIRDDLNQVAPRVMCVLNPLKVVLTNYPEDQIETFDADYFPHDVPREGTRPLSFSRELYIERNDFREEPSRKYFRLAPGREVRLKNGYIIRCDEVIKDPATGAVVELRCSYDPETRSGSDTSGKKVKGTIHWVSVAHAVPVEVRVYDRLFNHPYPDGGEASYLTHINPDSAVRLNGFIEPSVLNNAPDTRYQFTRHGYFWQDPVDSTPDHLVFNRIVSLRDSWKKKQQSKVAQPKPVAKSAPSPKVQPQVDPVIELTPEVRKRADEYMTLGLRKKQAERLASEAVLADLFDTALTENHMPEPLANWILNDVTREAKQNEALPITGVQLARLVALVDDGTLSSATARKVFDAMWTTGQNPDDIVEAKGLQQVSDRDTLAALVAGVVAENPEKVNAYRGGKHGLKGFFMGQVMRATQGKANPQLVQELVAEQLEG